jgi:rod shape-determining protein MreD
MIISAVLVQVTLSPYMKVGGVHPDLTLILVISWTILRGLEEGLVWAMVAGLSLDFSSGAPFGTFTLATVTVALLASLGHGRTFGSSIILPVSAMFPLSLLFNGLALVLLALLGRPIAWDVAFYSKLMPVAFFNTILIIAIFPLLRLLDRSSYPERLSLR